MNVVFVGFYNENTIIGIIKEAKMKKLLDWFLEPFSGGILLLWGIIAIGAYLFYKDILCFSLLLSVPIYYFAMIAYIYWNENQN